MDNYLRIGDFVTLKFLKYSAFLSAEGILVEDVGVTSSIKPFEDNIFQITIQLQYSAANGFHEFIENYPGNISEITDRDTKKHLNALMKGKQNEASMNEAFMKQKMGTIIKFGETIQLLHVKSGKYVTVKSTELARDERENMAVCLRAEGSMDCWLQIMPRFKINKEGDMITGNTEILLKVSERSGEFLHCADKKPPPRRIREVNSSGDSATPWRISIFTSVREILFRQSEESVKEAKEKDILVAGEIVYIRDPETNSMLMPLMTNENALKKTKVDDTKSPASLSRAETPMT